MVTVTFVDRFFRVRGNDGYRAVLDHLEETLVEAGFPADGLRTLELGPEQASWTPVRASLTLLGEPPVTLQAFDDERGRDRATLLVGSQRTERVELEVVLAEGPPGEVGGRVVLGRGSPGELFDRFVVQGGAAGILTVNLEEYHRQQEHPEVAQFGELPQEIAHRAFGFSISPRADATLREALRRGPTRVAVEIDVKEGRAVATTLEATLAGEDEAAAPVVFVAHIDEPGANDNASGVAALTELAIALHQGVESGQLPRPVHPVIFLWGEEIECSREWLRHRPPRSVRAALVFDMVGADQAVVGAPFLIERMPDPGAVWLRPPDEPSGWGGGSISPHLLRGHFLNDYVLASVRALSSHQPGWRTRSHPFEGGSDHVPFLTSGVPALLAWHFPDDAYHTTLDRADRVSGEEMARVAAALGAVAVGLASDQAEDHAEALAAVERGGVTRLRQAAEAGEASLHRGGSPALERRIVEAWGRWYDEALASISTDDDELAERITAARGRLAEATATSLEALAPTPRGASEAR